MIGGKLKSLYQDAVRAGDKPYKLDRQAFIDIDIRGDAVKGMKDLDGMVQGLDEFMGVLEVLKYEAQEMRKRLAAKLR